MSSPPPPRKILDWMPQSLLLTAFDVQRSNLLGEVIDRELGDPLSYKRLLLSSPNILTLTLN